MTWCDDPTSAVTLVGDYTWSDINVTIDVKAEGTNGVFVALRVNQGGCDTRLTKGKLVSLLYQQSYIRITLRCWSLASCGSYKQRF